MGFSSVLVANRGEIALRVMRSVREQGMRCVAVYSDADARAPHARFADLAVRLGASPASASYLDGEAIVRAALSAGAQAIHPGYGFLSENAGFARAVADAGLVFIGPPPEAIEIMGDKAVSKRAMLAAGVPCVPGYQGTDQSDARLLAEAEAIGLPLMVKAAAGGGGRGMRRVADATEIPGAIRLARAEAQGAFGSGDLILERAVERARHVEIQVFADRFGHVIHLGERDCSVQRRHQKVIEESPCPVMTPQLRERMGRAAVEAARAVDYVGAGTVEFLLEPSGDFYFLEMNTRLQVEHPVTEMVTGLDLVQMQLEVAQGRPLPVEQSQVSLDGCAIEARLYAEDPARDFLPCTGEIRLWRPPSGEGIRVDAGIETGLNVTAYYDAMVAKIIARGEDRTQALQRLSRALEQTVLLGPASNRDFLLDTLRHPVFAAGEATTAFVPEAWPAGYAGARPGPADVAGASVLQYALAAQRYHRQAVAVPAELRNWSSTGDLASLLRFGWNDETCTATVKPLGGANYRVEEGERAHIVELLELGAQACRLVVDGRSWSASYHATPDGDWHLCVAGSGTFTLVLPGQREAGDEESTGAPLVRAPAHGIVVAIDVAEGDAVERGSPLLTLEAMKIQHAIVAPVAGTIASVTAVAGGQVREGEALLEIRAREPH